jgi:hypothetical protein
MRSSLWLVLILAACGTDAEKDVPTEEAAFQIQSTDLVIQPGDEITKCWYFHTPNTAKVNVHKWSSEMTPGSHHMIWFTNFGTQPEDGVIDDCDIQNAVPIPVYGTQIPLQELDFPTDEAGVPLAQSVQPNSAGFFQMHYLNSTDSPLTVHVTVSAYALEDGKPFTRTDLFATYNNDIAIPPHAVGYKVSATCPSQPDQMNEMQGARFWQMSTHSHKQTHEASIVDGSAMVLDSPDWEHPASRQWSAPSFYTFNSGQVTWECTYDNTGANADNTVYAGQSARTNEMCMATGYYFPVIGAFGANGCVMSGGQCNCPAL